MGSGRQRKTVSGVALGDEQHPGSTGCHKAVVQPGPSLQALRGHNMNGQGIAARAHGHAPAYRGAGTGAVGEAGWVARWGRGRGASSGWGWEMWRGQGRAQPRAHLLRGASPFFGAVGGLTPQGPESRAGKEQRRTRSGTGVWEARAGLQAPPRAVLRDGVGCRAALKTPGLPDRASLGGG